MKVQTGLEAFLGKSASYKNRRIALMANQTSVTSRLEYSWDALVREGLNLVKIFSPEHGVFSTEQDQVPVRSEPPFPVRVVSLYGDSYASLLPSDNELDEIDTVLFDIQDVGSRYYTYVNTLALFMERCRNRDLEIIVLDRPNPLGGVLCEGPLLSTGFESFVGVFPFPVRHGLTAGELALYWKKSRGLDVRLKVMQMKGWGRAMRFGDTGLPWVAPSPNMPTTATALVYPGGCLIEGTNLSEGRGTTMPFLLTGAPFIDARVYARELNALVLPGVHFRPVYFRPGYGKHAGALCGGVFLHVTDEESFIPFAAGVAVAKLAHDLYPAEFRFLEGVYEFTTAHPAFDLLCGSPRIREAILHGNTLDAIRGLWTDDESRYRRIMMEYCIY